MKVYIAYETDEDHPDPYGDSVPSEIDTLSHTIEDATGWKTFNLLRDVLKRKLFMNLSLYRRKLLSKFFLERRKTFITFAYLSDSLALVYCDSSHFHNGIKFTFISSIFSVPS